MTRYIWPTLFLLLAAGVQGNLPRSISIMGGMPDLVLVVLIGYALAEDSAFGASLGFLAGFIQGSVTGMALGSFIATRTITGFIAGFVSTRLFSANAVVPTISALWLTGVCGILFQLVCPAVPTAKAIGLIAGQSIHNFLFTFIVYVCVQYLDTRRKNKIINAKF